MFTHRVIPYLKSLADGVIVSRTLKLFGIGESSMEAQLREEMEAMTNPHPGPPMPRRGSVSCASPPKRRTRSLPGP